MSLNTPWYKKNTVKQLTLCEVPILVDYCDHLYHQGQNSKQRSDPSTSDEQLVFPESY